MSRQRTPEPRQKTYSIALIEGDGVGPEISKASLIVLDALEEKLGLGFSIKDSPAGDNCKRKTGVALPESSLKSIRESDACLKAPVGETAADVIVRLRQMLDLYANVRPAKSLPNVPSLKPGIDMVIVRENTEDLYKGQEFEFDGGVVALRTITRAASERIAKYAFEMAEQRGGARKVVAVHKSNVLRKSDGLFAQVCREVSKAYPKVSFSEMLVDAAAMNLIRDPLSFDVMVTTNLYGDILSDEAAQLVGGLGMTPSANIGEGLCPLRAGARRGAGHRREGGREPGRHDPHRRHDAGLAREDEEGRGVLSGRLRDPERGQQGPRDEHKDTRPGREGDHDAGGRGGRQGDK